MLRHKVQLLLVTGQQADKVEGMLTEPTVYVNWTGYTFHDISRSELRYYDPEKSSSAVIGYVYQFELDGEAILYTTRDDQMMRWFSSRPGGVDEQYVKIEKQDDGRYALIGVIKYSNGVNIGYDGSLMKIDYVSWIAALACEVIIAVTYATCSIIYVVKKDKINYNI